MSDIFKKKRQYNNLFIAVVFIIAADIVVVVTVVATAIVVFLFLFCFLFVFFFNII